MAFQIVVVFLLLGAIALLSIILKKITHVDIATWDLPQAMDDKINTAESRLYRQLEAFHALNALIQPVVPLPPMRGWAGSPDFLLELAQSVMKRKPASIVECSSGVSTVVAARCCQLNGLGHVFSLEHEAEFADTTRKRLRDAGLEQWATVIDAPLTRVDIAGTQYRWYDLSGLPDGPFNMMVVDGPPAAVGPLARFPAGPTLIPRLSAGALVLIDDAARNDERTMLERWKEQFPAVVVRMAQAEKGLALVEKPLPGEGIPL